MSHRWVREMMGGKIKPKALCIARLMRINIIHETLMWHGQWGSSGMQHVPKVTSKHSQLLLSYEVPHVDKQSHQQTWCNVQLSVWVLYRRAEHNLCCCEHRVFVSQVYGWHLSSAPLSAWHVKQEVWQRAVWSESATQPPSLLFECDGE